MNDAIYLDHNATTPVHPAALDAMLPWLREHFGNPSSSHERGRTAAQAVAAARESVATLIGASAAEIVFTGCATEANNLALIGVAQALGGAAQALGGVTPALDGARRAQGRPRHLVISAVEHPAVMAPARWLQDQGWSLTVVDVDRFGRVDPADIDKALRPETALVSVMHANNEVGTLQPVAEIARLTRARGVPLHTDAAQSVGKISVDVRTLGADLLSIAGHKFGAPKGVGALYVRRGTPITSILHGAAQEHGLRPGTENVALIVALGTAARLARQALPGLSDGLRQRRDQLHRLLAGAIPGLQLNGHPEHRLPNTLHVSFPGVSGQALLQQAPAVAASLGSACHSANDAVSGVLAAMRVDASRAAGSVRLSVGRTTGPDDVAAAAGTLVDAWRVLAGSAGGGSSVRCVSA
jgi:cysteine desulfurase